MVEEGFSRPVEDQEIRLRINVAKTEAVEALLEVLELMSEDLGCIEVQEGQLMFIDEAAMMKYEELERRVDESLELQFQLAQLQGNMGSR